VWHGVDEPPERLEEGGATRQQRRRLRGLRHDAGLAGGPPVVRRLGVRDRDREGVLHLVHLCEAQQERRRRRAGDRLGHAQEGELGHSNGARGAAAHQVSGRHDGGEGRGDIGHAKAVDHPDLLHAAREGLPAHAGPLHRLSDIDGC